MLKMEHAKSLNFPSGFKTEVFVVGIGDARALWTFLEVSVGSRLNEGSSLVCMTRRRGEYIIFNFT